ncbi:MAG: hypothetical protein MUO21_06175 [Nitrososphaeraceae archaeon]|nr:hypothetical protein [Nitrososphaeraceae archaeon]
METSNEDINDIKKELMLKLLNKILVNIGKEKIKDIAEFIDIERDEIIKDKNVKSLNSMQDELFKLFNKKKSGFYRKTDNIVLNCLRGLLKELDYDFIRKCKEKSKYINGKSYRRKHVYYSIKNKVTSDVV